MKRATAIPFVLLVVLSIVALLPFVKGQATATPSGEPINSGDVAWMLVATALVLLMTPGLSFFYGGMVSPKNVISTMLQSFVALGLVSLVWLIVGFSLAFGDSLDGFLIGNPLTFFMFDGVGEATSKALSPTIPLMLFALFQLKFAIITPALDHRRVRRARAILVLSAFHPALQLVHLRSPRALDLASRRLPAEVGGARFRRWDRGAHVGGLGGAGRRHVPRPSQVHIAKKTSSPANIPFVILGTGMLWFGWFGFNAGSAVAANGTAAMAFATTNTASAAAMLGWMFFDWMHGRKPSALGACIGAVVGLVAITPACGYVTIRESVFIGLVASVISNMAAHWKSKSTLDDTLDVFPCHGLGGMVGMLMTGIFAKDVGLTSGKTSTFLVHLGALVIVSVFSFVGSWILYKVTDFIIPLRVSEEQELQGLDLSQHGETAIAAELLLAPSTNGNGVHSPMAKDLVLS